MSQSIHQEPITHWYQEPWAWFIVAIIVCTVSWGSFQVYVAFKNADEVVVDDYYKVGKAINQDLSRDRRAIEYGVSASLLTNNGTVLVDMEGNPDNWPQQLRLRLMPAAKGQEPQQIALLQTPHKNTLYQGKTQGIPSGRYYIQLETLDEMTPEQGYLSGWRLNREVLFETGKPVLLSPSD